MWNDEEEAQIVADQPCPYHVDLVLNRDNNDKTRVEVEQLMHPTKKCLNPKNPNILCNLLGAEGALEFLERQKLTDPEQKKALFMEHKRRMDEAARQQGAVYWINEVNETTGDGTLTHADGTHYCCAVVAGPPCV